MALQDILDAITAEADTRIADARTTHQQRLSQLREESERRLLRTKQEINAQREEKKRMIRMKGEAAMAVRRRNALLEKKRALMDEVYGDIEDALANTAPQQVRPLLSRLLDAIDATGTIHPAAMHASIMKELIEGKKGLHLGEPLQAATGGFLFLSDTTERDCTFATLVAHELRPQTETAVASLLFAERS